jgi:hypothetical protein
LRCFVAAMGGELQLLVRFPDEEEAVVVEIGDLTDVTTGTESGIPSPGA